MRARGQKTGWNQCQEQDSGSQVSLVTQRAISRKVHQLSPRKNRGSLSFHLECEYRVRQCQEIPTGRNTPEPKEIKKGFSTMGNPRTVLERRECRQRTRARRSADKENSPTLTPTPEQIQDEALQWDRKNNLIRINFYIDRAHRYDSNNIVRPKLCESWTLTARRCEREIEISWSPRDAF